MIDHQLQYVYGIIEGFLVVIDLFLKFLFQILNYIFNF